MSLTSNCILLSVNIKEPIPWLKLPFSIVNSFMFMKKISLKNLFDLSCWKLYRFPMNIGDPEYIEEIERERIVKFINNSIKWYKIISYQLTKKKLLILFEFLKIIDKLYWWYFHLFFWFLYHKTSLQSLMEN